MSRFAILVQVSDILHINEKGVIKVNTDLPTALEKYLRGGNADLIILLESSDSQKIHNVSGEPLPLANTEIIAILEKNNVQFKLSQSITFKEGSLVLETCPTQDDGQPYEQSFLIRHFNADIQAVDHDSLERHGITLIDFKTSYIQKSAIEIAEKKLKALLNTQKFYKVVKVFDRDETAVCNKRTSFDPNKEPVINLSVISTGIFLTECISKHSPEITIKSYLMTARQQKHELNRKENDPKRMSYIAEKSGALGLPLIFDRNDSFSFPIWPKSKNKNAAYEDLSNNTKIIKIGNMIKKQKIKNCIFVLVDNSRKEVDTEAHRNIIDSWKEANCEIITIHVQENCFSEEDLEKLNAILLHSTKSFFNLFSFFPQPSREQALKHDDQNASQPEQHNTIFDPRFNVAYISSVFSSLRLPTPPLQNNDPKEPEPGL